MRGQTLEDCAGQVRLTTQHGCTSMPANVVSPSEGAASCKYVRLRVHRPRTYRRDVSLGTNYLMRLAPSLGFNHSNWNSYGLELPCAKLQYSIDVAFFTTSPWTSRPHYIGHQERQSSEGIASPCLPSIYLRTLLRMLSEVGCQRDRRYPVQRLSQEDHVLNRLCPEEAQTALF